MDTLLVLSDMHINSSVALCKPSVHHDDGGTYHRSRTQQEIYRNWLDMLEKVEAARKGRLITIFNGDVCEGDTKDRSYQVISRNPATILDHARDLITPIAQLSHSLYFVRGTPAHTGKSSWYEEHLASDFANTVKEPNTEANSWFYLKLDVSGVKLDIAHEASMGGKRVTQATAAVRLADEIESEYNSRRETPPHLAIRSHVHRWGDSYDAFSVRVIFTPCWSAVTEYINRKKPGALGQWGALLLFCENGEYQEKKLKYKEPRKLWVKA